MFRFILFLIFTTFILAEFDGDNSIINSNESNAITSIPDNSTTTTTTTTIGPDDNSTTITTTVVPSMNRARRQNIDYYPGDYGVIIDEIIIDYP
uniref:Uncharacterized protein n=1 Tax=Panagrolaimus sp. JU765 TaxID=591449 RepID=A0AC34Q1P9_9BILA